MKDAFMAMIYDTNLSISGGDNLEAVKFVRLIKEELALAKVEIKALNQFIK